MVYQTPGQLGAMQEGRGSPNVVAAVSSVPAQLARNERMLALVRLRVAIGASEGVFPDEDNGERLAPEHLAVHRG